MWNGMHRLDASKAIAMVFLVNKCVLSQKLLCSKNQIKGDAQPQHKSLSRCTSPLYLDKQSAVSTSNSLTRSRLTKSKLSIRRCHLHSKLLAQVLRNVTTNCPRTWAGPLTALTSCWAHWASTRPTNVIVSPCSLNAFTTDSSVVT